MARTQQQILESMLGALQVQLAGLVAQLEAKEELITSQAEEIAKLKQAAPKAE